MKRKFLTKKELLLFLFPLLLLVGVKLSSQIKQLIGSDALDQTMRRLAGSTAMDYGLSQGHGVYPNDVFDSYKIKQPFYVRQLQLTPAQGKTISGSLLMTPKNQVYLLYAERPTGQLLDKGKINSIQHIGGLSLQNEGTFTYLSLDNITVLTPALMNRLMIHGYLSPQEIESSTGGKTRTTIE